MADKKLCREDCDYALYGQPYENPSLLSCCLKPVPQLRSINSPACDLAEKTNPKEWVPQVGDRLKIDAKSMIEFIAENKDSDEKIVQCKVYPRGKNHEYVILMLNMESM